MRLFDALSAAGITSFLSGASQAEQLGSMPMPGTDTDTKFEILDSNVVLITDQGTVVSSTQELPQMYEVFDPMDTARKYPSASFTLGAGESKPLTVEMTRPVKGSKSLKSHETWECSVKAKSALDDGVLYVFRADSTSDGEYPFIVGMNNDDKVSFDCKKVSSSTVSTE